jgi:hypothetical protein
VTLTPKMEADLACWEADTVGDECCSCELPAFVRDDGVCSGCGTQICEPLPNREPKAGGSR